MSRVIDPTNVTWTRSPEGHVIVVFANNNDGFTVCEQQVRENEAGVVWFRVHDHSVVNGPEREFWVAVNFDFYKDQDAEIVGAYSLYASINYLDGHYFNQWVADRKANLIAACALYEAGVDRNAQSH